MLVVVVVVVLIRRGDASLTRQSLDLKSEDRRAEIWVNAEFSLSFTFTNPK